MIGMRCSLKMITALTITTCAACSTSHTELRKAEVPNWVLQHAMESLTSDQAAPWQDEATGLQHEIRPIGTFKASNGRYCRDYELSYNDAQGSVVYATKTACRSEDQGWHRVKQSDL